MKNAIFYNQTFYLQDNRKLPLLLSPGIWQLEARGTAGALHPGETWSHQTKVAGIKVDCITQRFPCNKWIRFFQ